MTTKKITDAVSEIVELLTPLEPADRARVIQASVTLLGDPPVIHAPRAENANNHVEETGDGNYSAPARSWMRRQGITPEQLDQVFHVADGNASVIGEVPGKNNKEKTLNAYVLTGLAQLVASGNFAFDDKAARQLCQSAGCYDSANHSSTMKDKGNEFAGSKEKGWSLTQPGLKRAAELVKEMTRVAA
jgi:hypothetical protein